MPEQPNSDSQIIFLSVGTKNLLTDAMDQYVRTLGNIRTHYAPNFSSAMRFFQDGMIHILLTEIDLGDASGFRLVKNLGGSSIDDSLYLALCADEQSDAVAALASEMEVNTTLIKPFSAADLKALIDKYKVWRATPKEPWFTHIREGQFSAREKRFREAEKHFLEAIKASPMNPIPVYKSGLYYFQKPDPGMAEKLLKKAIEMKPDYIQAISALGSFYLSRGYLDRAEEYLNKAQQLSPLNPERLVEIVRLYLDKALDSCKNALRLDNGAALPRYFLGKLLAVQKDYIGAVRELEKALPLLKDSQKTETQTFIALARKLGGLAK